MPAFIDIPCSMLMRDLAAVCSHRWVKSNGSVVLNAPKGSRAVIVGADPDWVLGTLTAARGKTLQTLAALVDLSMADVKGNGLKVNNVALPEIGARLGSRNQRMLESLLRALTQVHFVSGPSSTRLSGEPGAPVLIHSNPAGSSFSPSEKWVRELHKPRFQSARLPGSFLHLHAKNDYYKILLSWYLAIMLRVNRKYGFHYRVGLGNLLEGAGITIPERNVSRFLEAIYSSLSDLPEINFAGPTFTLYSSDEILSAKFDFWVRPHLLAAYCGAECAILPPAGHVMSAERA